MEVDDDYYEETDLTINKDKKRISSSSILNSKNDLNGSDSFLMSDIEKKKKKKKKKSKSQKKRKTKEKKNSEKEIEKENDNEDIVTGNLILNKKKYIENKDDLEQKKVKFTKDLRNKLFDYMKEISNNSQLSFNEKFGILICVNILNKVCSIFKIIYIFKQIRKYQRLACSKICAIYKAYSFRKQFKMNYLLIKIINMRALYVSKIIGHIKGYIIRKNIKKILVKKEDNYIIYSTLSSNRMLYFKIKYDNNFEDNIYFEYCKVLNCFIFYLSNKERNLSTKKISGFFYNERYHKLTDELYNKNEKGENVIDFPKIIKKNNKNTDKYDKIIDEFMKNNRYKKKKFYEVEEYEENKRKALDDDIITNKKNNICKLDKLSRSKSYMKLKGFKKNKSILKPSKSYINLKSEERKIQFGKTKIVGYRLNQKYLSINFNLQ